MTAADRHIPAGPAMLGRAEASARLAALIEDDIPVVIVGEAGVGKTTLARAVLRSSGRRVHEGGGFAALAWMPWFALERALGRTIVGGEAADTAREVIEAVGDGVLFIDDLHWVDSATRAVVTELAGRIGLIVGVRLGDPGADAALAVLAPSTVRLDLEPLVEADAVALARRIRPDLARDDARAVARRAGGNPLLITELAAGGEGAVTLAAAVRVRLNALDAPAREAMAMLSLSGRPMAPRDLGPGAGQVASSGLAIIDGDGRLRPRHELIAGAAVDNLDDGERRRLHATLARMADDPGEAARQHLAAGERKLAYARAVEAAARAATPGERASHLELAAATAEQPFARQTRIQAVRALLDDRDAARALIVLGDLAGDPDPVVALIEAAGSHAVFALDRARASAHRGIASIRGGWPATGETEVSLQLEAARIEAAALGPPDRILAAALAAQELATARGVAAIEARCVVGEARMVAGDPAGLADLEVAMREAEGTGELGLALSIGNRLAFGFIKAGRSADGQALTDRLAAQARDAGMGFWEGQMWYWQAGFAWHGGDFESAARLGEELSERMLDDESGWYGVQAMADLGRVDEAAVRAERILAGAPAGEYALGEALWLCADVAYWRGRWREAISYAQRHEREVPAAHQRIFVELPLAWASIELGLPATWPSRSASLPIALGGSIELEALRSMATGAFLTAAQQFDDAAAAWQGRHARGELRSLWGGAECLRRAGRTADARARLLDLETRVADARHAPLLARTRQGLRRVGVRRTVRRQSVAGSPLTVREREILSLSGSGLRDREIATRLGISRWAVVRSAESAAAKLGTGSRNQTIVAVLTS